MHRQLFLSYSSNDRTIARRLQRSFEALGWKVWRDEVAIAAGAEWPSAIDMGLRDSAAVVVLISQNSAGSAWVTYEYAFATGAGCPVVAVIAGNAAVPGPIRKFQVVRLGSVGAARSVHAGLVEQIEASARAKAGSGGAPVLVAKFAEDKNGELYWRPTKKVEEIRMELWLENAPYRTTSVDFEVLADVKDPAWTLERGPGARAFLTDDEFSLYGDVDIVARGHLPKGRDWTTRSRLYDALVRYYAGQKLDDARRRALEQIRKN